MNWTMTRTTVVSAVLASTFVLASACAKDETTPAAGAANPAGSAYPQQGYPQQGYPQQGYPQQGAYPQQGYPQQPQGSYPPATTGAAPTGTAPATGVPATGGTMATPGPLALPCTNDSACGFAKCNTQYSKCAFPCQNSALDCAQGSACNTMTGLCLPGGQ